MSPVAVQDPLPGSYTSAEAVDLLLPSEVPPATSTLPSGKSVAVCPRRTRTMFPVTVHDPVLGSYSSAVGQPISRPFGGPPATSTLPSGSNVAVCCSWNLIFGLSVAVQIPLAGSYSSARVGLPRPPTTSTLPLVSSVAV